MNRNTVLAFLLILLTVSFFSSRFYYEKILKTPHPASQQQRGDAMSEHKKAAVVENEEPVEKPQHIEKQGETEGLLTENDSSAGSEIEEVCDTVWVETDLLRVGLDERGARIISVQTKAYRMDPIAESKGLEENPYIELVYDRSIGGGNLTINNESFDRRPFVLEGEGNEFRVEDGGKIDLVFVWNSSDGEAVNKTYTLWSGEYTVGLTVSSASLDGRKVGIGWLAGISESEETLGGKSAQYDVRKVHLYDGKNVSHIAEKKGSKSEESGFYNWVGLTSKYFLVAMINDSARDADVAIEAFEITTGNDGDGSKKRQKKMNYRVMTQRFASGGRESCTFYLGPSSLGDLKKQGMQLQRVLFGGWKWFLRADLWFPALCEFVLWLLITLHKGLRDYGLVIIVLTILSKLVTYPLTQSSMKSMTRMRELQPKITAIREKYKSNAQKMNQKMMELYKKEGVNPLNPGCLPMFLQMPVFISLFIVLRKAIELRGAGTWLIPWVHDLSKPEVLPIPGVSPLPFELPMYGSNIALMPIVMAVLTYFQNKATIKDPNQKAMIYFMPIFMLVLFNSFPSGLVLYWTFSSALQLVQQFATDKLKKSAERPVSQIAAVRRQ